MDRQASTKQPKLSDFQFSMNASRRAMIWLSFGFDSTSVGSAGAPGGKEDERA